MLESYGRTLRGAIPESAARELSVPLDWFPRLAHGTPAERAHWRLIADGEGIHWPELDEDISVEDLLVGRRSGESQASVERALGTHTTSAFGH